MNLSSVHAQDALVTSSIAWFYLLTNSLRGFTYIPQIIVVWRSQDGARSLSLLTWSAWLFANGTAVLYGAAIQDAFFTTISVINCAGCAAVVTIAAKRRRQFRRLGFDRAPYAFASAVEGSRPIPIPVPVPVPPLRWARRTQAYLSRWGYGPRWL